MKRRVFIQAAIGASVALPLLAKAAAPVIDIYKTESCGCCGAWVEHLKANGFVTRIVNVDNPSDYREKGGIPNELGSCHTGMVQGYAIEGQPPAPPSAGPASSSSRKWTPGISAWPCRRSSATSPSPKAGPTTIYSWRPANDALQSHHGNCHSEAAGRGICFGIQQISRPSGSR